MERLNAKTLIQAKPFNGREVGKSLKVGNWPQREPIIQGNPKEFNWVKNPFAQALGKFGKYGPLQTILNFLKPLIGSS